jgi:putative PEP-CTERM system TPR-repeat lipoprotein
MSRKNQNGPAQGRPAGAEGAANRRSGRGLLRGGAGALALGSALLLAGCFGDSAQDLLKSAKEHLDKKDSKGAIIQLKNALQKDESLAEARFLLARALLDGGDVAGAAIEAEKAKGQGYSGDAMSALQARLLLRQGKVDELIGQFGTAHLATAAEEADLQSSLVSAYAAKGDLRGARAAADAALRAAPDKAAVQLVNVRLLAAEGKQPEARAEIDRVLAKFPDSAEAWEFKGELQVTAQEPAADAITSFRKALSLDKKQVAAHSALVNLLLRQNDKAGAAEAMKEMRAAVPQQPQTLFLAAIMALDANNVKEATDLSQALLKMAPGNDNALFLAGRVALANGDLRSAESNFAKVLQSAPEAVNARVALAQLQLRGGDLDQAMATLQPALDAKIPNGDALALGAAIRLRLGQGAEAESLLARAAEANPNDVRSRIGLAMAQIQKGQEAQGLAALRALATQDAKGTQADVALISALVRKRDDAGAQAAIAALEKKDPKSATAPELRGSLAKLRGDKAGARAQFEEAFKREPASMAVANSLAELDMQDRKPEDAVKRYEAVLKADPKQLRAELAVIGLKLNNQLMDKDAAAKRLVELTKAHPEDVATRSAAVALLMEKKDLKQALSLAQEGVTANADKPELIDLLGQAQAASGDRQQAITSFNKLATLQPRSPLGQMRLAELAVQTGDKEAAATALKRAQAIAPGDAELARRVAERAMQIQKPEIALLAAKGLQTAAPKSPLGWTLEGDVARARKDWPAALASYRKAEQVVGDTASVDLAMALHGTLSQAGKKEEAAAYANAWMAKHKQDALFLYHLGDVALQQSDFAQAEQRYQAVLAINPQHAAAMNNVAWLRLRAGKPDDGLKFAEKANALRPKMPPYLDTWAEALAAKGQTAKAIEVQKQAVELAPTVPGFRLRLAQLYVAGGNKTDAQAELKRLADLGASFDQQAEVQKLQASIR